MIKLLKCLLLSVLLLPSAQAQQLQWAKSAGANKDDKGYVLTTDDTGNVYTAGTFRGVVDFDPGIAIFTLTALDTGMNIFVQKLDSAGNFKWAVRIGNQFMDNKPNSIKLDKLGNVHITGRYNGTIDFDPGAGVQNLAAYGISTCFMLKLNNAGDFIWARRVQGVSGDDGSASATDDSCNVYVVSDFFGNIDADPGAGVSNIVSVGFWDMFIVKLDSAGNFMWVKTMGANMNERCRDIEVDASGYLYICGQYSDMVDFDPGAGVFSLPGGNINLYVLKMDRNGNFVWARGTSGTQGDATGNSLTLDKYGNIYTTGNFHSTVDFNTDAGTQNYTAGNTYDSYVLKLNNAGAYIWAKQIKGSGPNVNSYGIATDTSGKVYAVGSFSDTIDADPATAVHYLATGETDISGYIIKLDTGGGFIWAHSLSGAGPNVTRFVATGKKNAIYTTGYFSGAVDFDFMSPVYPLSSQGLSDMFVQKISADTVATTAIIMQAAKLPITIYPNPTTKTVHISAQQNIDRIIVTDMLGRKVYESSTSQGKHTSVEMDMPGVYFITVVTGENISTQKIVVTR